MAGHLTLNQAVEVRILALQLGMLAVAPVIRALARNCERWMV